MASGSGGNMPKDTDIMKKILELSNVKEYEPNVLNQMLEFTYRYVTNILEDASLYSSYAKKKVIDSEDVKLAVCLQQGKNFTPVPSREVTADLARQKNGKSLPLLRSNNGLNVTSDRNNVTGPNYKLIRQNQPKVFKVTKTQPNGALYSGPVAPKLAVAPKAASSPIGNSPSNLIVKPSNGENKRKLEEIE